MMCKYALLLVSVCVLITGCASGPGKIKAQTGQARFEQQFEQAAFARGADGQYDFVFVADVPSARPQSTRILQPIRQAPVRHLLHVRVFWRPLRGSKPDFPAATNASIDWYVLSGPLPRAGDGFLHYGGVGYVSVYPKGDEARIAIRNARLQLADQQGDWRDLLSGSQLTGMLSAPEAPVQVRQWLSEVAPPAPQK